tara:strand:- start:5988 stop:6941 length:954 start_codon:yes stop_codon:yes gene_type:complete
MAYGKKASPLKLFGSRRRKREQRQANAAFNAQMAAYGAMDVGQNVYADFQNVYAGAENVYADAKNVYEGMENTFEDLRIDTTAAELAGAQFAQSQADQLAALGGGAGGSGFGALTTTMSRQAAQQSAANTADIRQQAIENERLARGEASKIQTLERTGAEKQQQMILSGADMQQQLILGGEQYAQTLQFQGASDALGRQISQQETMLGIAAGRKEAADLARQQNTQMWMNLAGDVIKAIPSYAALSDRRLKKNIELIGKSPSGINIYTFEYIDEKLGKGRFQGVMSDDIPKNAIVRNDSGFDIVDYSKIDIEFKSVI